MEWEPDQIDTHVGDSKHQYLETHTPVERRADSRTLHPYPRFQWKEGPARIRNYLKAA